MDTRGRESRGTILKIWDSWRDKERTLSLFLFSSTFSFLSLIPLLDSLYFIFFLYPFPIVSIPFLLLNGKRRIKIEKTFLSFFLFLFSSVFISPSLVLFPHWFLSFIFFLSPFLFLFTCPWEIMRGKKIRKMCWEWFFKNL
jgi:hypothetical protein